MDKVLYATGPSGCYLYNAPTRWAWQNIPQEIADQLEAKTISDIGWAAFGDSAEKYFVRFSMVGAGGQGFFYGEDNPASLNEWLNQKTANGADARDLDSLKVVFGQGNTFFAWDNQGYRWSGLSDAFQATLQHWLSPAGWKFGPPRIVALGVSGSFLAISDYGFLGRSLGGPMKQFNEQIDSLVAMDGVDWDDIENIFLSPTNANVWFITFKSTWTIGQSENKTIFQEIAYSYANESIMKHYRKEKAEAEADEAKKKKKAAAEEERKRRDAKEAQDEELRLQYALWLSSCSVTQGDMRSLTTFPHLPVEACICTLPSCKIRKKDTTLLACRHDVESLLRASGNYSLPWLRAERLSWHPDRFGRRCHPDHRQRLVKKCTEMYAIYEELIALEQNPQESTG